ncbi:MAG TPA: hypothetical protein PLD20_03760 [Blastocatellia bacterium]|nr:hypothetical protein [Blastocatellia bacterium]HMX27301.1 hypothetical protein [Blastocatellia bacterium]HMY74683.1 hypothetical protein [Blastocatellia bacterium]HMZ17020.1 hypothetical protein [Blastocatellia bacterium]HNG33022.1 hypothetical protein [Blastocatellia bacterium]
MTIIAIALFMVPFIGLCLFILLLGISDLYKGKCATLNDAASNQTQENALRENTKSARRKPISTSITRLRANRVFVLKTDTRQLSFS